MPAAHYLESWGDARTSDGTLVPIQPLIAPLFGGMTELEVLARIAGENVTKPYEIVRETFAQLTGGDDGAAGSKFLHDGFLAKLRRQAGRGAVESRRAVTERWLNVKAAAPAKDNLEVVFHRDYSLDDGRYNNNGWLQELPDPITKMIWDNAVLISRKTAARTGREESGRRGNQVGRPNGCSGPDLGPARAWRITRWAWRWAMAAKGRAGGAGAGFNAYPLRTSGGAEFRRGRDAHGRRARPIRFPAPRATGPWKAGRSFARRTWSSIGSTRISPSGWRRKSRPVAAPLYPNPLDELKQKGLHQWGMSIDLNACVGCSACVVACQSENNMPIVGKDQVSRGREMHWLRIDRYYTGRPLSSRDEALATFDRRRSQQFAHWIDDPQVVTQPMLCQHCEAAPCENVCPVNATVARPGGPERDGLQPLRRHPVLLEQLPLQGPPLQFLRLQQAARSAGNEPAT